MAQVSATAQPSARAMPTCSACAETFESITELRTHWKCDRHVHNLKHKGMDFVPLSQQAWEKFTVAASQNIGHNKEAHEARGPAEGAGALAADRIRTPGCEGMVRLEAPFEPTMSLFDQQCFATVDECLAHMQKVHSFFIPNPDDVTDMPGLLTFLGRKLQEPPHACICCDRPFPSLASVRRHMLDKGHTRVGTEAFSRRGHYDVLGTACLQMELSPFYATVEEDGEVLRSQVGADHGDGLDKEAEHVADFGRHFTAAEVDKADSEEANSKEDEASADSIATHIYECEVELDCEDELACEEVVRVLGLRPVKRNSDALDLRLPSFTSIWRRSRRQPGNGLLVKPRHVGEVPRVRELMRLGDAGELQAAIVRREQQFEQGRQVFTALRKDRERHLQNSFHVNKAKTTKQKAHNKLARLGFAHSDPTRTNTRL